MDAAKKTHECHYWIVHTEVIKENKKAFKLFLAFVFTSWALQTQNIYPAVSDSATKLVEITQVDKELQDLEIACIYLVFKSSAVVRIPPEKL